MTWEQMEIVADLAERYSLDDVRVHYTQNLLLPHVRQDDLPAVYHALKAAGLATPNMDLVTDIIACPGLDYCALANARAIPIAQQIASRFTDDVKAEAIGELQVKISGCINACGHHHVGHIGILGVDKKGEEFYQVTLGGSGAEDASLGQMLGPALPADRVAEAVEQMVEVYLRERKDGERFLDTFRRTGVAPFKEAVYADAD
jgi:sulfite reductase (NADPH) hemoprotein beta-component